MKIVNDIERMAEGWLKKAPHLPASGQKWLAENVWWIAIVGAVASTISVIVGIFGLFAIVAFLSAPAPYYSYYVVAPYTGWSIVTALVSLAFLAINAFLLWTAIKPLQGKTKKGWAILFTILLVEAVSVVVNAVLSLNVFTFIVAIIFGAIAVAIGAYFLFEIRSQFAHSTVPAAQPAKKSK